MSTHGPNEPEYLGAGAPEDATGEDAFDLAGDHAPHGKAGRKAGRTGIVVGSAVAVVAAVGVGAYGVVQLMSGGSSPATAVPSDAIAYVSLDLDPSASQKIEAFKILRKFPGLKKEMGSRGDIRKAVFEAMQEGGDCKTLDYATDVEPWIGDRVAYAAVPDSLHGAAPLVVLQVTYPAKAEAGARVIEACSADATGQQPGRTGISFVGDYMLLAETQREANAFARDAQAATLADDAAFTSTTALAGDPGILTMYVAKDAPRALATALAQDTSSAGGSTVKGLDALEKQYKDFEGAAGVVRFRGGAVETELAGRGLPSSIAGAGAGPDTATLPATTAVALSVAFRDGWLKDYLGQLEAMAGSQQSMDELLAEGERETGLDLPEDVETLLGDGVSLAVDSSADLEQLTSSPDPTTVPMGLRIHGDPAKIVPVIDKLKRLAGADGDMVKVSTGDGVVAVGLQQSYVDRLLEKGDLGSVAAFRDVVPQPERASAAFYVNFDAGDWAEHLADVLSDDDAEIRSNVAPLDALGLSSWVDGEDGHEVAHALVRLTTD